MKIRNSGKMRAQPEQGVHFARVVGLADIGHQPGFTWSGGDVDSSYKLELTYELVNTDMPTDDDELPRPFWVSEEVTNTDNDKGKLKKRVTATGISFDDPSAIIDKPVMVTIEHNDKGYAKITNVAGVPQGQDVAPLRNNPVTFDIYSDTPDVEQFESFPEFKRNKITGALDFSETALYKAILKDSEVPY